MKEIKIPGAIILLILLVIACSVYRKQNHIFADKAVKGTTDTYKDSLYMGTSCS